MMRFLESRWVRLGAGVVVALVAVAVLAILAFPLGSLKPRVEARLSARFGRPVTIGSLEREGGWSLTPTILVRDIRVPQAEWAGPGDLARIARARVRVRVLPLLLGRFSPQAITASGVRLDFVRDRRHRENWSKADDRNTAGGDAPRLDALTLTDTIVRYRDAVQDRSFMVGVVADSRSGVRVAGRGSVRGTPVKLAAAGPGFAGRNAAWPFTGRIDGPALTIGVVGTMDAPLDTDRMTLKLTARASDLKMIDAVIEAGLFATRPVAVTADVRHDDPAWTITNLAGTIGGSDLSGRMTVTKHGGRTKLAGEVASRRLDFEDLATDASTAQALALEQRIGLRVVPNTRINIGRITKTDGRVAFRVDHIVSRRRPSSLASARGVLSIDRQLAIAEPLTVGLRRGAVTGSVRIEQRGGAPEPRVTLALVIAGSSIGALAGGGDDVDARVDGRIRLAGRGSTIREVVGRSDGSIGLVARDGALPAKMAALLGFDVGRSLVTGDGARAALRCAVVRLAVHGGRGTIAPLVVDTSLSQTRGTGVVTFPDERIAASLTGAPKRASVLRLPGAITAGGTIRDPKVTIPPEVKSAGNILKAFGRAITGRQGPAATDADCAALTRQALSR